MRNPPERRASLLLAAAIVLFLVAATLPYAWLIANFGYDDILRQPAADVLAAVHDGGSPLVLAWLAFALSALLFIPVVRGFDDLFRAHGHSTARAGTLGVVSAVVQATGLLRWVFVVPPLAATVADPLVDPATRQSAIVAFATVHRLAGTVMGEMIGQLLLAGWTVLVVRHAWRTRILPRWALLPGAATIPLWLMGQSELLHQVVPMTPLIETTPAAFMLWEAWLAIIAGVLLARSLRGASQPDTGPVARPA